MVLAAQVAKVAIPRAAAVQASRDTGRGWNGMDRLHGGDAGVGEEDGRQKDFVRGIER